MGRFPVHRIALGAAALLLLALPAAAFDPEVLRVRLIPKDVPQGTPPDRLEVSPEFWKPDEMVERERREDALRVTQDYVSRNLPVWASGTPLASVERLRHTDLSLTGDSSAGPGRGLDVKLRLAEQVRLTVAAESFRRDLMYDPLGRRMWVDLYSGSVPGLGAGYTVTNTYGLGDQGDRLMLNLRYRFQ